MNEQTRASEHGSDWASKDSQMLKLIKQYRVLLEISFNVFDPNVNSKQSSSSSFSSSSCVFSHSLFMNLPCNSDNDYGDDKQQVLPALESDCCLLCSAMLLLMFGDGGGVVRVLHTYSINTFIMYLPVLQVFSSIYLHPFHWHLWGFVNIINVRIYIYLSDWLTDWLTNKGTNTRTYAFMHTPNRKWKPFRDNQKKEERKNRAVVLTLRCMLSSNALFKYMLSRCVIRKSAKDWHIWIYGRGRTHSTAHCIILS